MKRFFRPLLALHRWLAVLLVIPLAILAISGAGLAFSDEIDRALNPDLRNVPPEFHKPYAPLSSSLLTAPVINAPTHKSIKPYIIYPAMTPYDSLRIDWLGFAGNGSAERFQSFYNPYTAQLLGSRNYQDSLPVLLAELHRYFWFESNWHDTATTLLKGALPFMLLLILLGMILLFLLKPRHNRLPQPKTLHQKVGALTAPFLLFIMVSALLSLFSLTTFNPSHRIASPLITTPQVVSNSPLLKTLIDHIDAQCPTGQKPYQIWLNQPEGITLYCQTPNDSGSVTQTQWKLSVSSSDPIEISKTRISSYINNVAWALHTGEILNLPGRLIWMWASLLILILIYTGLKKAFTQGVRHAGRK
jgi:uncharacterized iron-regulated membrane protein